jgi:hypothetical protein
VALDTRDIDVYIATINAALPQEAEMGIPEWTFSVGTSRPVFHANARDAVRGNMACGVRLRDQATRKRQPAPAEMCPRCAVLTGAAHE